MLDLKLIRSDPEAVKEALRRRGAGAETALEQLLELDRSRREFLVGVEERRGLRNSVSEEIARLKRDKQDAAAKIEAMRTLGDEIKDLETKLKDVEAALEEVLLRVPNLPDPTAPNGGEEDSAVLYKWGTPRAFAFTPLDHLDLAAPLGLIDMDRGARISGSRFAYLLGDLVFLQFALVQFALQKLAGKGFRPAVVPVLVRDEAMYGTGFFPTDMQQVYRVEADGLNLVGTSEVPLAALHMDEILDEADLPLRYVGYSSCFRREAGAAGKDTRGIFRVHQFDKVEMFSFCAPDKSAEEHDFMRSIEEEVLQELGLPYQAVNIAAGDLGAPAAKKYDLEAWLPTQERYREVTSCSNCTDYQARRLKVRAKGEKGGAYLLHTLNGTVVALGRTMIAIMENYQTEDGLVEVPAVLKPFMPAGMETLGAMNAGGGDQPRRGVGAGKTSLAGPRDTRQDISQSWAEREDLALLTDYYQLTMMGGFWKTGRTDITACFDYTFRELPPHNGFAIAAGLEQFLDLLEGLRFTTSDLDYLSSLGAFDDGFLDYLRDFRPRCSIEAVPEGTVVFPHEPIVQVEGPLIEAQLLETALLNSLNYPTLIATKAARIRLACGNDKLVEFGLRRAQGPDGALSGSRAAYIGGADSTSNVLAGKVFGIPVQGTQAHSWVMSFDSELEAFRAYAECSKDPVLLVDTYDTLTSGLPNAVQVFKELRAAGRAVRPAIRLDSGDLARLSKAARRMFNEAGFDDPRIIASNELDEDLIADLKRQGAPINTWGVGTHLITSSDHPALGGVYKLVAVRKDDGEWEPRIKLSSNPGKMTDPGRKRLVRYLDGEGKPLADIIRMADEPADVIEAGQPAKPVPFAEGRDLSFLRAVWDATRCESLLQPVMQAGERVSPSPTLEEVRARACAQVAALPEELRRLRNPEIYEVGLSPRLAAEKIRMGRQAPGVLAPGPSATNEPPAPPSGS